MLYYKIDVFEKLKAKGYTTYKLQSENLLPQSAAQKIRNGEIIGVITLDKICSLLQMQPGSIIGWKPDEEEKRKVPKSKKREESTWLMISSGLFP